jgi:hypothetical protein
MLQILKLINFGKFEVSKDFNKLKNEIFGWEVCRYVKPNIAIFRTESQNAGNSNIAIFRTTKKTREIQILQYFELNLQNS